MNENEILNNIKEKFDYVEVYDPAADFTAIKLKVEPFVNTVIKFNTVKFTEHRNKKLDIDFGYSVIRSALTEEELKSFTSTLDELASSILTYVLLWANDNDKMHLIPFKPQ